jgi:sulfate adenylyltransferase
MSEYALNRDQYLELEKLAVGAFLPLTGFMNEEQFHSVVETLRLPGGEVFPLPVVLDITHDLARVFRGRASVTLTFGGEAVGEISPDSFFEVDKPDVARKVFGTDDADHPGVGHFFAMGEVFMGGPVKLTKRAQLDISRWELLPSESKSLFAERGWKRIAGFQTRNVPHRAHEYLQRVVLEQCDGLFIQPLVGRKKVGDCTPEAIMASYQVLIDRFYRPERAALGILSTAMRYAGPREALFHALIRRNYGCTHFVIGRDHAGVGSYYGKYAAHELVERFESEMGIEILRVHGAHHCRICDGIVTEHSCPHHDTDPDACSHISGTDMRAILSGNRLPQPYLMRPEIVAAVKGLPLFVEEND